MFYMKLLGMNSILLNATYSEYVRVIFIAELFIVLLIGGRDKAPGRDRYLIGLISSFIYSIR